MTFSRANEQREQAGTASIAQTQTGHTDCRITEMLTIVHHLTSSHIDIRVPLHVGLHDTGKNWQCYSFFFFLVLQKDNTRRLFFSFHMPSFLPIQYDYKMFFYCDLLYKNI